MEADSTNKKHNGKIEEQTTNSSSEEGIHLKICLDGFQKCTTNPDKLLIDEYCRAMTELNKFFQYLGTVFNFIANDLTQKVNILRCYRQGGAGEYYFSMQSMVQYEKDNEIVSNSGSRTLLRLHHATEFIIPFLHALIDAKDNEKMGPHAAEIYRGTLAKHHGWLLSKTVGAVFLLLPTRQVIIEKVTQGNEILIKENLEIAEELISSLQSVYDLTQKLYEENNILDLP